MSLLSELTFVFVFYAIGLELAIRAIKDFKRPKDEKVAYWKWWALIGGIGCVILATLMFIMILLGITLIEKDEISFYNNKSNVIIPAILTIWGLYNLIEFILLKTKKTIWHKLGLASGVLLIICGVILAIAPLS